MHSCRRPTYIGLLAPTAPVRAAVQSFQSGRTKCTKTKIPRKVTVRKTTIARKKIIWTLYMWRMICENFFNRLKHNILIKETFVRSMSWRTKKWKFLVCRVFLNIPYHRSTWPGVNYTDALQNYRIFLRYNHYAGAYSLTGYREYPGLPPFKNLYWALYISVT